VATAPVVQGFDKGRGPVGLPLIGQACQLPVWPDQGPREGSLVKSRRGAVPARRAGRRAAAQPPPSVLVGPRSGLATVTASIRRIGAEQGLAVIAAEQEDEPVQVLPQLGDVVCGVADELFQRGAEAGGVAGQPLAEELQ
jgi:hypothetical protein